MKQLRAVLVILVLFVLVLPAIRRWDRAERAAEREARRLKPNPWQVKYEARLAAAESTKAAKTPEELKALFAGFDEDTTEHVVHSDELRDAFSAWYAEDMRLALEMSEALPERKRYFVFRWGEAFYQKDPGLFLECARKYLDTLHEHDVSLNIFQELGETDVEKGLELLPDVKARQIRETVVPVFYGAWAQRDAAKARESARTLESARDRKIAEDAIARVR